MYSNIKPIKDNQDAVERLQYLKRLIQKELCNREINPYLCDISAIQQWLDPSFNANDWEMEHREVSEEED